MVCASVDLVGRIAVGHGRGAGVRDGEADLAPLTAGRATGDRIDSPPEGPLAQREDPVIALADGE